MSTKDKWYVLQDKEKRKQPNEETYRSYPQRGVYIPKFHQRLMLQAMYLSQIEKRNSSFWTFLYYICNFLTLPTPLIPGAYKSQ